MNVKFVTASFHMLESTQPEKAKLLADGLSGIISGFSVDGGDGKVLTTTGKVIYDPDASVQHTVPCDSIFSALTHGCSRSCFNVAVHHLSRTITAFWAELPQGLFDLIAEDLEGPLAQN